MHTIEPYYNWRHLYIASEDPQSPMYGYFNSEVEFTDRIFDHIIHPQWDNFGCETLFLKILFVDYSTGYAIIEFLGEWNDAVHNDIMSLKRDIIDEMLLVGIDKYILIGENILNFHADITDYYEEWLEEVPDGWMAFLNLRPHVLDELSSYGLDQFFVLGGQLDAFNWRTKKPELLYKKLEEIVRRRLDF
ncbi:MAG: Uncharacterised protein [Cryomorphaceae bacterium]|nr:MAG: Uncharacterised protein [Cryomorphaceae bacterium]